jgi:hypothetical protein
MFATLRYNSERLSQCGVDHEIIFVEWNPLKDRPLLSQAVTAAFENASCYVVDDSVHQFLCENKHIAVYEYHAKNVGATHAKGEWLMIVNPDVFLGREVIDFIGKREFDTRTLYRTGWINIMDASGVDQHGMRDEYADDAPPYSKASGDFVLLAKDLFDEVGGYREDLRFTNTHKDTLFCRTVYQLTNRARKIGCVYHLDHSRDKHGKRRVRFWIRAVPLVHQPTYGHRDITSSETVAERITLLKLNKGLRRFRLLGSPRPRIPKEYRIDAAQSQNVFVSAFRTAVQAFKKTSDS